MVFALKVIAPATLEEGYSFDATVDGRTFRVRVPEGGVVAGQEFVVHDSQEIIPATKESSIQDDGAPRGQWRKGLFSCFDTMFSATFWMAFLCPVIQMAQLQTRFHLNWLSRDAPSEAVRRTFISSMIVFLVFWSVVGWFPESFILYLIFYLFVQTRLRRNARIRYDIPGNVIVDFLCTLICSCCSTIQMVRQTHDEKVYPYDGCSTDGLPLHAPPLLSENSDIPPNTEETVLEGFESVELPVDQGEVTQEVTVKAVVV